MRTETWLRITRIGQRVCKVLMFLAGLQILIAVLGLLGAFD